MNVPIEVSARHVHLSQNVAEVLFGKNHKFNVRKNLSQPGQYACEERVDIIGPHGFLNSASVLGPFRHKTQVEISLTDARKIGLKPPVRESGNLRGTPGCILRGTNGEVSLESGVIIAKRHIHMHTDDAMKIGVKNGQICEVRVKSDERSITFGDVAIRVNDKFALAMHIDTDESGAMNWLLGAIGAVVL